MHNRHSWKEKTLDGDKREVRAVKFAGKWTISSKLPGDETWTKHEPPQMDDLEFLRDLLWRKYRRRRASYDDVKSVEKLISDAR